MTDATAGRGGVGIRLFIDGEEVVRRGFKNIRDDGKKMFAEIALGEKSANPAIRAVSATVGELKAGVSNLAAQAGSAATVLASFGATGMAVAAALGALAIGLVKAREGMQFAATLTDTSDRIGVSAEALQEWRYVADEAGVSVSTFEGNLEKLNGQVGAFKLGIGDGKLKPVFEELGITKEQLSSVDDGLDMMLLLADTLGQVKDRATQVKLARSMGVEESLPILRLGSDAIRRMADDARDLGLVMNDDVRKQFDEADRAMEVAQQRIDMALRGAVVSLAEEFADLVTILAEVIQWLDKLQVYTVTDNPATRAGTWVNHRVRDLAAGRSGAESDAYWNPLGTDIMGRLAKFQTTPADNYNAGGGFAPQGHTSGGSNKAEREAEQRRQREERAKQQLERVEGEIAGSYDRGFLSNEGRFDYEVAELERERATRLREIARAEEEYARSNGLRGLTEAEAEILKSKQDELFEQKKAVKEWERRRAEADRRLQEDEDAARAANDLLDVDAQLARTTAERVRIEREILLASIEIARRRRQAELDNDPELDDAQRTALMERFNRDAAARVHLFDGLEDRRLKDQFKSYGKEVVEAINDGRIGAKLAEDLQARLMDFAWDNLANLFSMGAKSGGSGGGWMSAVVNSLSSLFGGGRAGGGGTKAGFRYELAEHNRPELFMLGGAGQVTNAADTARMLTEAMREYGPGEAGSAGGLTVNMPGITINAPGADAAALARVERQLDQLRRDMPGMAVRAVTDARQRNHGD